MTRNLRCARALLAPSTLAALAGCASIDITRDTETSGRFESSGLSFTVFSIDLPKPAINIARDNASDARLTNSQVTEVYRWPDLGWWDWTLDILGWRYAKVVGTWGFTGAPIAGTGGAASD